MCKRLVNQLI